MQETQQKNVSQILDEILIHLHGMANEQSTSIRLLQAKLEGREEEIDRLKNELEKCTTELSRVREELDLRSKAFKDIRSLQEMNKASNQRIQALETSLANAYRHIDSFSTASRETALALDVQRERKISRLIERLFDRTDIFSLISPPFQQIKDDTLIFNHDLAGYRLRLSRNLQKVAFSAYPVTFYRRNLKEVLIAPILDIPITRGTIGIELVSSTNQIVAQSVLPADEVYAYQPFRLAFAPVYETNQGIFELRVFARDLDVPLRLYEWQKYPFFGLGRLQRKAFCGFEFVD